MKVKQLFWQRQVPVQRLYAAIVASARQPRLYQRGGAPDTVEGRLVMITIFLWLAVERLKQLGERQAAQQLVEAFFADMEGNLRESGVSDVAIPKRMRALEAIYVQTMKLLSGSANGNRDAIVASCFSHLPEGRGSFAAVAAVLHEIEGRIAGLPAKEILAGRGWN